MTENKIWSNPYSLLIQEPGGKTVEVSFGTTEEDHPVAMITIWDGEPGKDVRLGHPIVTVHLYATALMEILKEGWESAAEAPEHWNNLCDDDEEFENKNDGSTH